MQSLKSNLENEYKKIKNLKKKNVLNKLTNILKDPPKIDPPVLINV